MEEEQERVIEPIASSITLIEWASQLVVVGKSNRIFHFCGDFKVTINNGIHIDQHPLPRLKEIFSNLEGGQKFSVINLKDAYLQMAVKDKLRTLLLVVIHKGYYCYKRLPFGVIFGPALFQ